MLSPETPRRAPTQRRSRETVQAILQAAARILVREGRDAVTTNRVAKDAGVSIGSLYQYFSSRDAIIGALAQEHASEMIGLLLAHAGPIAGQGPREAIPQFVSAMIAAHKGAPDLHLALLTQMLSDGPAAIKAVHDPARGLVRAWLGQHAAAIRPRDLDAAAFLLTTTVEAAIHAQIIEDPQRLGDPAWEAELVDLLLRYLLP